MIPASLAMTQIKTSVPSSVMSIVNSTVTNTTAGASNIVMIPSTSVNQAKMVGILRNFIWFLSVLKLYILNLKKILFFRVEKLKMLT